MIRVDTDFSATPFKAKIADAEQLRVHTMLGIRPKDMAAGNVSVRLPHGGPQGMKPKAQALTDIVASIGMQQPWTSVMNPLFVVPPDGTVQLRNGSWSLDGSPGR